MPTCCHWEDFSNIPWYDQPDGVVVTDPIPGRYIPNCALFAALSSYAWAQVDPYRGPLIPPKVGSYRYFKLYNPANVSESKIYYVSSHVCVDDQHQYVFGRSKNPYGEIWPAIWEKAYAAFRLYLNNGWYSKYITNNFDMCSLSWGGNAVNALITLTGSTQSSVQNIKQKQIDGSWINLVSPDDIIGDIIDRSVECDSTSRKVISPNKMVAWTYYSSSSIPNNYNPPPPKPYTYNSTISANHSYVILGLVYDAFGNSYIVLRNPVEVCPPLTGAPSNWCGQQNILNGIYGMIAVPLSEFHTVFETYGWVL